MSLHVNDGGTWKEVQNLSVYDGGSWKDVAQAMVRDGDDGRFFIHQRVGWFGGNFDWSETVRSRSEKRFFYGFK